MTDGSQEALVSGSNSRSARVMMISSDCHAAPVREAYRDYLEARHLPDLETYIQEQDHWMDGLRTIRAGSQSNDEMRRDAEQRAIFATQLDKRLEPSLKDGFVSEVIFPDGAARNEIPFSGLLGGPGGYSTELNSAALRAYNRWLAETACPERQIGLALIPLHDPKYAAEQARKLKGPVLRGVMLRWDGTDEAYLPLFHPDFDELWAACASEGLPIHFHFGDGVPRMYGKKETLSSPVFKAEIEFWCRRPLWHFILGGVLERHPTLKLVFTETKLDWIPRTLQYMDWEFDRGKIPDLPQRPSEYWVRQCYMGATTPSILEQEMRHELGPDRFMYGTDFPHVSSPWGVSLEYLQATFPQTGYTEEQLRSVLGVSAAKLYELDVQKLAPLVEDHGLHVHDILGARSDHDPREILQSRNPNIRRMVDRPASIP
jgi:predicted TIM-barrel fold metal-dependent hydrolase